MALNTGQIYDKITKSRDGEGRKVYDKLKELGYVDKKIQEYTNRENTSGTKRIALDNMVLNFDDVVDQYRTEKFVSNEKREEQDEVISMFLESILQYNVSLDGSHNKFKEISVKSMGRVWNKMDRFIQDSGLDVKSQRRFIRIPMDDFDVYLFKGTWAVVPPSEEDLDDEFEEKEIELSMFVSVLDSLSDEIKNELQTTMKSNFMFFFEDNQWFVVDGVFVESHEALDYETMLKKTKEESKTSISNLVGTVINNRNRGRTPEQPTQQTSEEHGWDDEQ